MKKKTRIGGLAEQHHYRLKPRGKQLFRPDAAEASKQTTPSNVCVGDGSKGV